MVRYIEAAARAGDTKVAEDALKGPAETAQAGGTEQGLGLEACSRALFNQGNGLTVPIGRRSTGSVAPGFVPSPPPHLW